jgi:arsenite oxidase large subunit
MYHELAASNGYAADTVERWPMAPLEINPLDAKELGIASGDIIEVFNDYGSTYAMAYLEPAMKRDQVFMQFGHFNGVMGDVTTDAVDRNVIPYYKGAWANLRKVSSGEYKKTVSFKSRLYKA